MNKVILIGRFTRDPESRMTGSNTEVARFSLACSSDFVSRDGERQTEFINCVAFGRTAETISKYCSKGTLINVTGRIRNGSYDAQDGSKRYTTDVVVENFEFLNSRANGNGSSNSASYNNNSDFANANANNNIETTNVSEDPYSMFGEEVNITSDDLPF